MVIIVDRPMPFHEFQQQINKEYYSSRPRDAGGTEGVMPFKTPVFDPVYIEANARDFISFAKRRTGRLDIYEFGAADGRFARGFLNYLRSHAPEVYGRVLYHAWDLSKAWTKNWERIKALHRNTSFHIGNVQRLSTRSRRGTTDIVYCHELFDDLPTRIVSKRDGKLMELWFKPKQQPAGFAAFETEYRELSPKTLFYKEIERFMQKIPERVRVPINIGAARALFTVKALLKTGGELRAFDYGQINRQAIPVLATASRGGATAGRASILSDGYAFIGSMRDAFNAGGNRVTGVGLMNEMQLTAAVNFGFLDQIAKRLGLKTKREPDYEFVSRAMRRRFVPQAALIGGLAYGHPDIHDKKGPEGYTMGTEMLAQWHPIVGDIKVKKAIQGIIEENGNNLQALEKVVAYLHKRGIMISVNPHTPVQTKYFVEEHLTIGLLSDTERIVKRIRKRAKGLKLVYGLIPEEREKSHWSQFDPEIKELERLGYRKREITWQVFGVPAGHRVSGHLARVSFQARKPKRKLRQRRGR